MSVDLSRIGLEGIETGQRTLNSIAARKTQALEDRKLELENEENEKLLDLQTQAAKRLQEVAKGEYKSASTLFDGVDEDSSAAKGLEIVADTFLKGGAVKQGTDSLKAAMTIRNQESEIEARQYTNQKNKIEAVLKGADVVSQTVGVAQNESEWRYGLRQLKQANVLGENEMAQLESMDYDPDVVKYLNEQAVSAAQRAQMDLTASNQAFSRKNAEDRLDLARQNTEIAQARLRLAETVKTKNEKEGKPSSAPTDGEVKSVSAAVKNKIFKGSVPAAVKADFDAGVQSITSRAKAMVSENKALDWDTAVNRAIAESEVAGDWKPMMEMGTFLGIPNPLSDKVQTGVDFDPKGKTPDSAMALPANKKLVTGRYYVTPKGTLKWNGSAFESD